MIKDSLVNSKIYYNLSENIKIGFEWIKNNDLKSMPDGRYELSSNIFANVQSYQTKETAPYEAHRDYIDIQYMIDGEELSGVASYTNCSVVEKYDKEKDIEFLSCNVPEQFYKIQEGEFFVFFPTDAHKPAIKTGINAKVKKVIVKVHV